MSTTPSLFQSKCAGEPRQATGRWTYFFWHSTRAAARFSLSHFALSAIVCASPGRLEAYNHHPTHTTTDTVFLLIHRQRLTYHKTTHKRHPPSPTATTNHNMTSKNHPLSLRRPLPATRWQGQEQGCTQNIYEHERVGGCRGQNGMEKKQNRKKGTQCCCWEHNGDRHPAARCFVVSGALFCSYRETWRCVVFYLPAAPCL
jgi:hypothetical protein